MDRNRRNKIQSEMEEYEVQKRLTDLQGLEVDENFHTMVVLELAEGATPDTLEWLLKKIKALRHGDGKMLATTVLNEKHEEAIIHISATPDYYLIGAELMEIKKTYRDGTLREICMADIENFRDSDDLNHFLSMAEKQRVILHDLEAIRAEYEDKYVPGFPEAKLHKDEAIVPACLGNQIIKSLFPLHDKEEVKRLGKSWIYKPFDPQPLMQIQRYFGETVAMYFAFLGNYTMALIPPAFIGVMSMILPVGQVNMQIFFSIFNIFWTTLFLEVTKRQCAVYAYSWGSLSDGKFEEARAAYHGKLQENKITRRLEPSYPKWKRGLKYYCVSLPFVIICLIFAFWVMLVYFWLEGLAFEFHKTHSNMLSTVVLFLPTIFYAVVIVVMNSIYRKLAKALNDWENHRLQSAYDNHLIVKLVSFDFVNCFMSLFYVAFYLQDMKLLKSSLGTLLITQQVLGQVQESLLPYLMYKRRKRSIEAKFGKKSNIGIEEQSLIDPGTVADDYKLQGQIEASKDEYEGTLDDYLEMFLQFGYVFLFSAVFPTASVWALLNNFTEIRSDAFKMCKVFQRPFAQPTSGIGAWQVAFELMSVMAVMTNCALIALSPGVQEIMPKYGALNVVLLFVLAEHIILAVKLLLSSLIPDFPDSIEVALKRVEFESKQAWKKERGERSQQLFLDKAAAVAAASKISTAEDDESKKDL